METSQTPEAPTSPLSRDILSAVTRVRGAAEQSRAKVASKLRGAKIGALGLTAGLAFFLAACQGEAKPPEINASLPPTTPVPEIQVPAGGSPPFELATKPTEKEVLRENIDELILTVRGLFHEDYFKRMGYDLDKIGDNLKNPDETTDTTRLVRTRNNIQNVDTHRLVDPYNYPRFIFKDELPFHVSFERDTTTGEITKQRVAFWVSKNGNLLTYRKNFPYAPETQEDFDRLVDDRLSAIVRMPEGNKSGIALRDLDWQSSTLEEEFRRRAVIDESDKGTTSITINGVKGNGLNLVSVEFVRQSKPAANR